MIRMNDKDELFCKVCLCKNKEVKLEVIAPCASVQKSVDPVEKIFANCSKSFKHSKLKIKPECDEIYIEETKVVNTFNFQEVNVKEERTDIEALPFTNVLCNSFSDDVKIEHKDPLESTTEMKCEVCRKDFCNSEDLENHQNGHKKNPDQCEFHQRSEHNCDVCLISEELVTHKIKKPYKCDICKKDFRSQTHLREHERTHTGEKPFKCDVCGKELTRATHLKMHKRIHEPTRRKAYKCDVCPKDFFAASDLKKHQITHTGDKPYKCDVCCKYFYGLGDLKKHQRTHTGEKPYKCEVCCKYFRSSQGLDIHRRTHTGEKPFKCDICDREFSHVSNFKLHKTTHVASREKRYKCDICPKEFYVASHLKNHLNSHSGEKQFKCDICEKGFTRMSSLKLHRRSIHLLAREKEEQCRLIEEKLSI